MNIKQTLLQLNLCVDNEYLVKYAKLIKGNINTPKQHGKTNRHHIIPRSYFKRYNLMIDDTNANIVNLSIKNHILAHYYLSKCSKEDWFQKANQWAVSYCLGNSKNISFKDKFIEEQLISVRDTKNNCMLVPDIRIKHDKTMRSDAVRTKISNTMKQKILQGQFFTQEHRKNLQNGAKQRKTHRGNNVSVTGYVGGTTNLVAVHTPEGKRIYTDKDNVNNLLGLGYTKHGNTYSKPDGFNKSKEFKQAQKQRLLNYYKNNPDFISKSKKSVRIFNDKEELIFDSLTKACVFLGASVEYARSGYLRKYIKSGVLTNKNWKCYGYNIEYYKNNLKQTEVMSNE